MGGDQDSSFLASKSGETTTLRSGLTDATGAHSCLSLYHIYFSSSGKCRLSSIFFPGEA